MTNNKKERMSAFTHFLGVIFAVIGMILLVNNSLKTENSVQLISFIVFGISMILLYTASTVYHITDASKKHKKLLRRIDHMMIFVLIAGTYTPICLNVLKGAVGRNLLIAVWTFAIIGIFLKVFWIEAPRKLVSSIYIIMGWLAVFALSSIINNMDKRGIFWLVLGGIVYTIGGVIYGTKKPNITTKWFGFHEIFHLFVLGGTVCHFVLMYKYV